MQVDSGYSCSINGNELKYDWSVEIPKTVQNDQVLLARLRCMGFDGFNVMQAGHNLCLVVETSGSSEMRLKSDLFRGSVSSVAKQIMEEKKGGFWGDRYDFAVRNKTTFESIASAHVLVGNVTEAMKVEACDVVIIKSLYYGFSGVSLKVKDHSPKWGEGILEGTEIPLLQQNQRAVEKELRQKFLQNWRNAVDGGGIATVVTGKGMAKTEVPAGTLIDHHENLILPDGRIFKKTYSGQGRGFSVYYTELADKIDTSKLDIFRHRIVRADMPSNTTTRIFGCRHGAAQSI